MNRKQAKRLESLPPYLFVRIDQMKRRAIADGRDVIDFGVGDPDQPTPDFIVERMAQAIRRPENHRYALGVGAPEFRRAAAAFFQRRFDVSLNVDDEILAVIGSKEAIGHLPLAIIDPGDVVLIPEPGYPVYASGAVFAGGTCHYMALSPDRGWRPDLQSIPTNVRRRARLMYLNYPNNPTGACAPRSFFEEAVAFAKEHDILVVHDAAYSELFFADPPPSILQVSDARDVAVELHSLSKTFNMTGWRIGFAVGNADALAAVAKVKSNVDSGIFSAVQEAGIAALEGVDRPEIKRQRDLYARRRDVLVEGLRSAGWTVEEPQATFYLFVRCPGETDSMQAATRILQECDVVVIPGVGFGPSGEGYVRFSLTVPEERTRLAVERLKKLTW